MKTHQDLPPQFESPSSGLADWEYVLFYGQDNQPPIETNILQPEIWSLAAEPKNGKDDRRQKYQKRGRQDHGTASTERGKIGSRHDKALKRPTLSPGEMIHEGLTEKAEIDDDGPMWPVAEDRPELANGKWQTPVARPHGSQDARIALEGSVPSDSDLEEVAADLSSRSLESQRDVYNFIKEVQLDPETAGLLLDALENEYITKGQVIGALAARAAALQQDSKSII